MRGFNINNCASAFDSNLRILDDRPIWKLNLDDEPKPNFNYSKEKYVELEIQIKTELPKSRMTRLKSNIYNFFVKKPRTKLNCLKARIIDLFTKRPKKMECPIQLKMTRNYITLQCNHIIGFKPFINLMKNGTVSCPMCRTKIKSWKSSKMIGVTENYTIGNTKKLIIFKVK